MLQPSRLLTGILFAVTVFSLSAQDRPSLLFREDWKELPAALPVTAEHVANANLTLQLHGPGQGAIKKSNHDQPLDDPFYIWSGECVMGNWAVSLQHQPGAFDLTRQAKVRWRSKQSGFRELRLIIQTASGDWFVSDQSDPASSDWRIREFNIADINWLRLDIETIVELHPSAKDTAPTPDLAHVISIGFTDLMIGGKSRASSRLDWIEVYAHPAPRH